MITEVISIIVICFTAFSTFLVQRRLSKAEIRDSLHHEFRKKKNLVLEELSNILADDFELEETRIILFPKELCEARFLNKNDVYIMATIPLLGNIEIAKLMAKKLGSFCAKNQIYLENELLGQLDIFMAYLNNYIYYCESKILSPNHLTALLLRDDIRVLQTDLFNQIRKSYSNPVLKKEKLDMGLDNEKKRKRYLKKTSTLHITNVIHFPELDDFPFPPNYSHKEKRKLLKSFEEDADLYIHADICRNCNLKCDLAGLYFTETDSTESTNEKTTEEEV